MNAPAEWYRTVHAELDERLRTEPCRSTPDGRLIAHVDDFLVCGDESSERWMEALSKFYGRFRCSPWETNEYMRCGVRVKEGKSSPKLNS